jgi:hypothetical protein
MEITYSWGMWEETWPNGRFQCVFCKADPRSNGMIHATGLYRASQGDTLFDIDTFQEEIRERAAVICDGRDGVLVKGDVAELLTLMPAFLQELSDRLGAHPSGPAPSGRASSWLLGEHAAQG